MIDDIGFVKMFPMKFANLMNGFTNASMIPKINSSKPKNKFQRKAPSVANAPKMMPVALTDVPATLLIIPTTAYNAAIIAMMIIKIQVMGEANKAVFSADGGAVAAAVALAVFLLLLHGSMKQ